MWWNRPDGRLVRDVAPYRAVMPLLSRGRNGAAVYLEQRLDTTAAQAYLRRFNEEHPGLHATLFHLVVWALVHTLHEHPRLNRFIAGGRHYQRDEIWISYSAKKEKVDGSPIVVIKRRFDPSESFADMVAAMQAQLTQARSDAVSATDRELRLLTALPIVVRRGAAGLLHAVDSLGLLPAGYIRSDPLYASLFVANLGSLKMDSVFHHLYEYGTISVFCAVGAIHDETTADGGRHPAAALRFTYDERVEDGLYAHEALQDFRAMVEDPLAHHVEDPLAHRVEDPLAHRVEDPLAHHVEDPLAPPRQASGPFQHA